MLKLQELRKLTELEIAKELTITRVPEATKFLKGCNYRLESALDAFYSDSTAMTLAETQRENGKGGQSAKKLNKLWDRYKGERCSDKLRDMLN